MDWPRCLDQSYSRNECRLSTLTFTDLPSNWRVKHVSATELADDANPSIVGHGIPAYPRIEASALLSKLQSEKSVLFEMASARRIP